jgi:hypothetical protein
MYTLFRCSICGFTDKKKTNFCENCGSIDKIIRKDYPNEPILGRCDCGRIGYHSRRAGVPICAKCGRDTVRRITREKYLEIMDNLGEKIRDDEYYMRKLKYQLERDKQKKIEEGEPIVEELIIDTNANDGKELLKLLDRANEFEDSIKINSLNLPKKLVKLLENNSFIRTTDLLDNEEEVKKIKGIGPEYLKLLERYFIKEEPKVENIDLISELEK